MHLNRHLMYNNPMKKKAIAILGIEEYKQIEKESKYSSNKELLFYLFGTIGIQVTGYMLGVTTLGGLDNLLDEESLVSSIQVVQVRLNWGYRIVKLLVSAYGVETTKAWLFGSSLDEAPISAIQDGVSKEDFKIVLDAAKSFICN